MEIPQRKGDPIVIDEDEGIRPDTTVESLAKLRPAFATDGTITAGTSSPISDGAAAVVVMSQAKAEQLGLTWLAEIGAHGNVAGPDNSLHSQPANAIKHALDKAGLSRRRPRPDRDQRGVRGGRHPVDARARASAPTIVNVNGGAIALGHPIGMSGARLVLTLALELRRRGGGARRGGAVRRRRPGRRADPHACRRGPRRSPGSGVGDERVERQGRTARIVTGSAPAGTSAAGRAAREGDPRAVARLITLVEDGDACCRRSPRRWRRTPARPR